MLATFSILPSPKVSETVVEVRSHRVAPLTMKEVNDERMLTNR
jgi:hypothetical protein